MLRRKLAALAFALLVGAAVGAEGGVINVAAGGDLQSALDRAQPGDVVLLEPGAVYVGNYVLGVKPGARYITVRAAIVERQLPPSGSRITPNFSGRLPRIQSPNDRPALTTAPGAHHWRLLALEFGPGGDGSTDVIRLGDGSRAQTSVSTVPHDLIVDRCYIHGRPDGPQKRGIALNSAATQIINSWISDFKVAGQDSQAIAGWNGPGPFMIVNNYLEAAGENLLFGGSDPAIEGLVPTGITIRNNWIRKQTSWREEEWQVKNLLELKSARGVVIENNLLENNWHAAQAGYAVLFTPRNQDGQAPWSVVEDVTFRGNVVRHVASGVNILGHDSPQTSGRTRDIEVANNLFYDVGGGWGGDGNFMMIGDGPAEVRVEHNTVLQTGNILIVYGGNRGAPTVVPGFVFRNNVTLNNAYGIKGDALAAGKSTISAYFPGGIVVKNVFAGGDSSVYPNGNLFPSIEEVYRQFVNASAENFQFSSSSNLAKAATDGTPVGADPLTARAVLAWALNNVVIAKPRTAAGKTGG